MKRSKPRRNANADWWYKKDLTAQRRKEQQRLREDRLITEQLAHLDDALGAGNGACRERNRLRMSLAD